MEINTDSKTTEIKKDFLPVTDIENLEEGIVVYGIRKVNSILEDYE